MTPLFTPLDEPPVTEDTPIVRCACGYARGLSGAVKAGWRCVKKIWSCDHCNEKKRKVEQV